MALTAIDGPDLFSSQFTLTIRVELIKDNDL